jgi:hypothetical protein
MTLDEYKQLAASARSIDPAKRKAALWILAGTLRRVAWSSNVRAEAHALAAEFETESRAIDADPLAGMDALIADGQLTPT